MLALATSLMAQAPPVVSSTPGDRSSLDLTLYHPYQGPTGSHSGFGLLREVRRISVPRGTFLLQWMGLPREVTEESAQLEQVSGHAHLVSLERNYDRDLLTPARLREAHLGRPVRMPGGAGHPDGGNLLSLLMAGDSGLVLETPSGLEVVAEEGVRFPGLPRELLAQPTLSTLLTSDAEGEVEVRLTLLVERLTWTAHFTLEPSEGFKEGRVLGSALIENQSDMAFQGARLALVAGPVARTWKENLWILDGLDARPKPAPGDQVTVEVVGTAVLETLGEAHLFHWPHPFDLVAFQTKQVALLDRPKVRIEPSLSGMAILGEMGTEVETDGPGSLVMRIQNRREDEGASPWPEGHWWARLATPEGAPVVVQEVASSVPVGESLELTAGPVRLHTRRRLVEVRRPLWGRYSREEIWEVQVDWESDAPPPGPALLRVGAPDGVEVQGPPTLVRRDPLILDLPVDLSGSASRTFRFNLRYPKSKAP